MTIIYCIYAVNPLLVAAFTLIPGSSNNLDTISDNHDKMHVRAVQPLLSAAFTLISVDPIA